MKKVKHILSYPLKKLFKHDVILTVTTRSIFLLFLLFSIAWFTEYFFIDTYICLEKVFYVAKNTLYLFISLLPLGYFISKFSFCITTLISFYMIIFLRVFWIVDKYIIEIENYEEINLCVIVLGWLIIAIDRVNNITSNRSK